jgi:PTH1 family peptidyl-tRNA hydrolase
MLIDRLFARAGGHRFRDEANAQVAEVTIANERVVLAKPQTYMNLSGGAVRPLLERYGGADAANLIVSSDDVALPFGMIRVRRGGSAGGQNGLKSIIAHLNTDKFARVRLGVKPDHPVGNLSSFVLSPIPKRDYDELRRMLERAADAVEVMLSDGVERAMSLFNERLKAAKSEE